MGERKQPYKYLSKVYIYSGIFSALLYFSGKTITRLNPRYHYKHLCKVHISNGNFNLGRNVHEAIHKASAAAFLSLSLSSSEQAVFGRLERRCEKTLTIITVLPQAECFVTRPANVFFFSYLKKCKLKASGDWMSCTKYECGYTKYHCRINSTLFSLMQVSFIAD